MNEALDWLLALVQGVDPLWRNVAAGIAIMLETSLFIGLIMPGDTVVLVASTGVVDLPDFFWLIGAVLLGSLIGETIGFFIMSSHSSLIYFFNFFVDFTGSAKFTAG